jgi:transcriptional regulator with GAF, ATPase, and Fis domain
MRLEGLRKVALALSQERLLEVLLKRIADELIRYRGIALARLWIAGRAEQCEVCRHSPLPIDRDISLHLRASAGRSLLDDSEWTRIDDVFHHAPANLQRIFSSGQPLLVDESHIKDPWPTHPEFVRREHIRSFAGYPLTFAGERLGVVAVFSRMPMNERDFEWVRLFSVAMGAAIANARAFEEIDALRRRLEVENRDLRTDERAAADNSSILGASAAIRRVLDQIEMVASTDASVLILGETGVGKELVARAIHERSPRRNHPMVNVNCTAVPHELFESVFFGHVKGAFSGAVTDRLGRFAIADRGSLFLDEVGDLPAAIQPKLLRVLENGEYDPVGDEKTHYADVRIIAASNHDLRKAGREEHFREDLYYRLSVFEIEVPPLRERKEDIPALAAHFAEKACERFNRTPMQPSAGQLRDLQDYKWPGNVRELQNIVERSVITARLGTLQFDMGAGRGRSEPHQQCDMAGDSAREVDVILTDEEMRRRERDNIAAALRLSHGRIYGPSGAAVMLGIKPTTLNARIKKWGLERR